MTHDMMFRGWLPVGFCLAGLAVVAVAGCGKKAVDEKTFRASDAKKVAVLLESVSVAASDPASFEGRFAKGSAPKPEDRAKYAKPKVFRLDGDPEFSGDTATFNVKILNRDPQTDAETEIGQAKWTAVRDELGYLLKDAPLP